MSYKVPDFIEKKTIYSYNKPFFVKYIYFINSISKQLRHDRSGSMAQ